MPGSSTNGAFFLAPTGEEATMPPLPDMFHWGPVDFHPHLLYRVLYGNGIQALPGQDSKTVINEVYPGFSLNLGGKWSLDYTPSFSFYSNPHFRNVVNQSVDFKGAATMDDWYFSLEQSYDKSTQPLVETGAQTEQEFYLTSLGASWQVGSRLSFQFGLSQSLRTAAAFSGLKEWETSDWADYHFQPELSAGLGLILGYDSLTQGSDMKFEQLQGRVQWRPGTKLVFQLSGGGEERQFVNGGSPDLLSPTYGADISYQALPHTTISFNANRTVTPSLFANQLVTSTSYSLSLRQGLSRKFSLQVAGDYSNRPFQSIQVIPLPTAPFGANPVRALQVDRTDSQWSVVTTLDWAFVPRATASVFYSTGKNSTGVAGFSYSTSQAGMSLAYRF